jgi:tyrosinase
MTINKLIAWSIAFAIQIEATQVLSGAVLPRENIKAFSQDATKLGKLRDAVAALQSRHLDDATCWFDMAAIHGILPSDPALHNIPATITALFNQCHNDDYLFFLWHRAYVAAIERLMQDAIHDPDFRLPYWDWYSDPSLPEAFRDEYLDPQRTKKNPLYMPNRNNDVNGGKAVWTPAIRTNFDNAIFSSFQDQLNSSEHGAIHLAVGKSDNMGAVEFAARDPIFFLHHAQIDRLLPIWIKIDPKRHLVPTTSFTGWKPEDYRFPIPGGAVATPTIEELALDSMEAMGYTYDNLDRPKVAAPVPPLRPQSLRLNPTMRLTGNSPQFQTLASVGQTEERIEVGAGVTVDLVIEHEQQGHINSLIQPAPATTEKLFIVFDGVQVKELPPGVLNYDVFVNLPERPSEERFNDYYVGSIGLFKLQHEFHHHGSASIRLPITEATGAAALRKALQNEQPVSKVSISLVPELAPDASTPTATVLSIKEIRLESTR